MALLHCDAPVYLGVTLDRTLMYKYYYKKTSKKIKTRNGLLQKLIGSKWRAQPHILSISTISFCFSVGEHACELWGRSTHVKKVDTSLNDACRIVTGSPKNTPVDHVFLLAGIASTPIRRLTSTKLERQKQVNNLRYLVYGQMATISRLKSRKNCLRVSFDLENDPS